MTLAKLTIAPETASGLKSFEVMFNPNNYSVTKPVTWTTPGAAATERRKNAPLLEFSGGGSRTMTLDLFFDTTDKTSPTEVDVRAQTNQIVKLTQIVRALKEPRPPICTISWGAFLKGSDFPFTGVVTQLTQHFTLFRPDGRPLRANVSVAFSEWLDPTDDQKETDPEFTTRLIKRGDTLSSIAAEVYSDPARWRTIAEANQLDDPRQISVGLRLNIPKVV